MAEFDYVLPSPWQNLIPYCHPHGRIWFCTAIHMAEFESLLSSAWQNLIPGYYPQCKIFFCSAVHSEEFESALSSSVLILIPHVLVLGAEFEFALCRLWFCAAIPSAEFDTTLLPTGLSFFICFILYPQLVPCRTFSLFLLPLLPTPPLSSPALSPSL